MNNDNRSFAFSILKIDYGWNGATNNGAQMLELDTICERHECPHCAAQEMAAYLHDNVTGMKNLFRPRIDGKPNNRTVERDRNGQKRENDHGHNYQK